MRATLADESLGRLAGRFVWLELDFDVESNQEFLTSHGVNWTPALFVLDAVSERATATKFGGMTLAELKDFLARGEAGVLKQAAAPAEAALARGDELAGKGALAEAAAAYREALRLGGARGPERPRALASLVATLLTAREFRACAEAAARD